MKKTIEKIGCCGFAASRSKYFKTFAVVEVQQTFYQPPKQDTLKRWRDEAPANFEFTLKAWQLITHEASSPTYRRLRQRLSEGQKQQVGAFRYTSVVQQAWEITLRVARMLEVDKVVFQCPPSFKPTDENENRMREFFSRIDRARVTCIWEPRGRWQDDQIAQLCRELNLVHCVDPFKAECVTDGLRYYRLHGITGYRHTYSDEELHSLARYGGHKADTYFFFNNMTMYADAKRFVRLLG
jgi:uncharacterized protein YecE (DUF72 family)